MSVEPEPRSVVLDACVLVPIKLTMTLLWLAQAGLFEPLWSQPILDEVENALHTKRGLTTSAAASRVEQMRDGFDAALIDGFDDLIEQMTCDAKDRHVLAAAVHAEAGTLVTTNLRDFPDSSTARYHIAVEHPDTFLTRLLMTDATQVLEAIEDGVATLRKPPMTTRQWLAQMTTIIPIFANQAADMLTQPGEVMSPVPAMVEADEGEMFTAYGDNGDLTNPAQVALLWWSALLQDQIEIAQALTYDPNAWGDYGWVHDAVAGRGLASKVIPSVDAPYLVAFMRFVPEPARPALVFQGFATSATVLTMVRVDDGTWRAWGLGPNMVAARDVVGDDMVSIAQFEAGGGTAMVFNWLERLLDDKPEVEIIWGALDDPLRLAFVQDWLLQTDAVTADERDTHAQELSARGTTHPLFESFYDSMLSWFRHVYANIDGKPALIGHTETVGVGLELIGFTTDEVAENYTGTGSIPAHTFITRHVGEGHWVIAANSRRLPVPGWPPTEQEIPGLEVDGN